MSQPSSLADTPASKLSFAIGSQVGSYTVLGKDGRLLHVRCACGAEDWHYPDNLRDYPGCRVCLPRKQPFWSHTGGPKTDFSMMGRTFGSLLVEAWAGGDWLCRCVCGTLTWAKSYDLSRGNRKTCGRCQPKRKEPKALIGRTFGQLKVIRWSAASAAWECLCSCGETRFATTSHLKQGAKSCVQCWEARAKKLRPSLNF